MKEVVIQSRPISQRKGRPMTLYYRSVSGNFIEGISNSYEENCLRYYATVDSAPKIKNTAQVSKPLCTYLRANKDKIRMLWKTSNIYPVIGS